MKTNNYKDSKKIYTEILDIINKYKDDVVYDYNNLIEQSKHHLFGIKLKEEYGLNINSCDIKSSDYIRYDEHRFIGYWGKKYRRTISWSDNDKQPEDELLLVLGFSTGAYMFGDDYPIKLFQEFFKELKTYNPKYTDIINHNLYFSMENAGKIFNKFPIILEKYYEKNKAELKQRQIKKLQDELQKLKNN